MSRRIFVVGGAHSPFIGKFNPAFIWRGHPEFGTRKNPGADEHLSVAVRGALKETKIDPDSIERGYVGNFLGELFSRQGLFGAMVADAVPELEGRPFLRLEAACASGASAVVAAAESILLGCDVTLAVGTEVEANAPGSEAAEFMARACYYEGERGLDHFVFPYLFARRTKAYKAVTEASADDLARVVAKAYGNANLNPNAHMHNVKVSFEDASTTSERNGYFIDDPEYHEHIRFLDCTHFSDGASAVILASEEGLKKAGIEAASCTELVGFSQSTASLKKRPDPTFYENVHRAACQAYENAGMGPDNIDVAEVHDCFSISELQMYEAAGFADRGKGYTLAREGKTERDAQLPVNTGGGLLAFGHPVGATGVKQVLEIYRQMKGHCGDYQLKRRPEHGLSLNMGGEDRHAVAIVQRNLA